MNDQQSETAEVQRPTTGDLDEWKAYWKALGMPWRTEPEINADRQRFLHMRRDIEPDIDKGIYPFRDENGSIRLNRPDVEWLLATHMSGGTVGPVDWSDEHQRACVGIDLRGANLRKAELHHLPLARAQAGVSGDEWKRADTVQREWAGADLREADLSDAHLEGIVFNHAQLGGANLRRAHLEEAELFGAHMESLLPTDLIHTEFDKRTILTLISMGNKAGVGPRLGEIRWGDANISGMQWGSVRVLGDEFVAQQRKKSGSRAAKGRATALEYFQRAVRANRQVSVILRSQGLNEDADRFAYRGQVLQRVVLRWQGHGLRWLGSLFLDLISGYGYKPMRSLIAYLLVIGTFAVAYYLLGNNVHPPLDPLGAVIFSITSFHGRGFAPGENVAITNPVTVIAAGEAIIGLLIEITFIATFTQRFFAR